MSQRRRQMQTIRSRRFVAFTRLKDDVSIHVLSTSDSQPS
jgi:hypothetical protein